MYPFIKNSKRAFSHYAILRFMATRCPPYCSKFKNIYITAESYNRCIWIVVSISIEWTSETCSGFIWSARVLGTWRGLLLAVFTKWGYYLLLFSYCETFLFKSLFFFLYFEKRNFFVLSQNTYTCIGKDKHSEFCPNQTNDQVTLKWLQCYFWKMGLLLPTKQNHRSEHINLERSGKLKWLPWRSIAWK